MRAAPRWWIAGVAIAASLLPGTALGRTGKTAAKQVQPVPAFKVTAVRFWSLGDITRIAIEVSGEFEFKSDRLAFPDRVFFDIVGAKPGLRAKGMSTIAVGDRLVKKIRVAETQSGTTRVVIDLQGGAEFTASQLSSPDRLIVELRNADSTAPSVDRASTATRRIQELPKAQPASDMVAEQLQLELPPPLKPAAESRVPAVLLATAPPRIPPTIASHDRDGVVGAPAAARRGSDGDRSLTRVLGLKLGRVVIDPGHGGHDVGTSGPTGLLEKDLVLDVAQRLGALIERRLNSEVVYTRSDDTFIPLQERTSIANQRKADLFLSIHANSSPARSASGVESYYLNFTASKSALEVAARENAGSDRSIYDLKDLVQQIALKDKVEESREFADKVQSSMMSLAARTNTYSKDRGVRKAPFVVLIGASMPSVLVEIGFLSNPKDEAMMKKPEYREKIAEALFKGLSQYAGGLSHFQVAARRPDESGQTAGAAAGR